MKDTTPAEYCNYGHTMHHVRQQQMQVFPIAKEHGPRPGFRTPSVTSLPTGSLGGRVGGSLDRRRRRLRNRNERDQRARSQNDLLFCERDRPLPPHYCSLQQFQYVNPNALQYSSNPYVNSYNNDTEVTDRTRKRKLYASFIQRVNKIVLIIVCQAAIFYNPFQFLGHMLKSELLTLF